MRALLIAVALLSSAPALASDESSDLAAIRAELASLRAEVATLRAPPSASPRVTPSAPLAPSVAPFAMMRRGLMAIGGPLIGLPSPPIFGATISGGGGGVALGDTPTWTGAHTFSADVTLNGGVGALGFGAGETIVPADAELNVTGSLTASNGFTAAAGGVVVTNNDAYFGDSYGPRSTGVLRFLATGGTLVDGAADVVQLTVQSHSTQTTFPFVVENSAGTDQFTVSNAGEVVALNQFGTLAAVAANGTGLGGQINAAHISGGGGLTTGAVAGTGCGTASAPTQSGNDIGGKLGATCGSGGTVANPIVTITFADAYSTAPFCTLAPADAATAAVMVSAQVYPVTTTTTLAAQCGGGTCPTGTFSWSYSCSQ